MTSLQGCAVVVHQRKKQLHFTNEVHECIDNDQPYNQVSNSARTLNKVIIFPRCLTRHLLGNKIRRYLLLSITPIHFNDLPVYHTGTLQ